MEHLKHGGSFQTDKTRQADLLMPALSCENRPLKALLLCTGAYLLFFVKNVSTEIPVSPGTGWHTAS